MIIKNLYFTLGNIYNNSFYTFLLILFAFLGQEARSADIALATSTTILFTQIFSGNMRNIIIASNDLTLLKNVKQFRIFFSSIVILFSSLLFFLISGELDIFTLSLIFLMSVGWINEMNILEEELNLKKIKIFVFLIINFIFTISVLAFIFFSLVDFVYFLIIFQSLFNIVLFIRREDFINDNINVIKYHIDEIKKYSYAFYSSFSMIIANFISRALIFTFVDKDFAGILFASYAIGSFPGTIFNNTFGPTLIKSRSKIPNFIKLLFTIVFILILILLFQFFYVDINFLDNKEKLYFTSLVSLTGSFFMVYSLYLRQRAIQIYFQNQKIIFSHDIFLNLILVLLISSLILFKIQYLYYFLFFIFSIISICIYKFMTIKMK